VDKISQYRQTLKTLPDWDAFLLQESGLPGPRGNIELAQAIADEGDLETFERYLAYDAQKAPTNSPQEFLAFCGVVGLGRMLSQGRPEFLGRLRAWASDPRWRIREGVAMALQRLGAVDMDSLLKAMWDWSAGNLLEKRAAAAAICEPALLHDERHVTEVLHILDKITTDIPNVKDRKSQEFQALKKGMAYCWSVAVPAFPTAGKPAMEKWFTSQDKDVLWIMKENLKKNRLVRADADWVKRWKAQLGIL
jgi:hypothetical protein